MQESWNRIDMAKDLERGAITEGWEMKDMGGSMACTVVRRVCWVFLFSLGVLALTILFTMVCRNPDSEKSFPDGGGGLPWRFNLECAFPQHMERGGGNFSTTEPKWPSSGRGFRFYLTMRTLCALMASIIIVGVVTVCLVCRKARPTHHYHRNHSMSGRKADNIRMALARNPNDTSRCTVHSGKGDSSQKEDRSPIFVGVGHVNDAASVSSESNPLFTDF